MQGTYLLILRLETTLFELPVGRLGALDFPAGYYLYVGSALGAGGLDARLARHARRLKERRHWHIDYLREHCDMLEAWSVACHERLEYAWVGALSALPELRMIAPGFGASDSPCVSHLFFSAARPSPRSLTEALLAGSEQIQACSRHLTLEVHTFNDA